MNWRSLAKQIQVSAIHYAESWGRNQINIRAASLTYTTILSLVPAIAVCVYLFAQVAAIGVIPKPIHDFLVDHLPPKLSQWLDSITDLSQVADMFKQFLLRNLAAGTGETALGHLDSFVSNVNFRAIGLAGLGSVLLTSVLLLFSVENSMNVIWRAPRAKSIGRRIFLYLMALIFAPLVLSLSFAVSAIIASLFPRFLITAELASFLAISILFCFGFKFFPNTRVKIGPAIISGLFTAIGIELLKVGFGYYTARSLLYSTFYGGLSVLPFFLVWLYANWILVLAGTQLTFILQNRRFLGKIGDHHQWDPHGIFDQERASLIFAITERLRKNDLRWKELLQEFDMPEFAVANAVEWMRKHHWVKNRRRGLKLYLSLTQKALQLDHQGEWAEILGVGAKNLADQDVLTAFRLRQAADSFSRK